VAGLLSPARRPLHRLRMRLADGSGRHEFIALAPGRRPDEEIGAPVRLQRLHEHLVLGPSILKFELPAATSFTGSLNSGTVRRSQTLAEVFDSARTPPSLWPDSTGKTSRAIFSGPGGNRLHGPAHRASCRARGDPENVPRAIRHPGRRAHTEKRSRTDPQSHRPWALEKRCSWGYRSEIRRLARRARKMFSE